MTLKHLAFWLAIAPMSSLSGQDLCEPTFTGVPAVDVGSNFGTNSVADFDGNGDADLSVGLNFLLGDGAGGFGAPARLAAPAGFLEGFDVQPDDYDKDGMLDVAMTGSGPVGWTAMILIYWGSREEGALGFFEEEFTRIDVSFPVWHIRRADFDKNGLTDIVAIAHRNPTHLVLLNEHAQQSRTFSVISLAGPGDGAQMLATGDFDGDTNPDFISGRSRGLRSEVAMFYGNGDGTFQNYLSGSLRYNASIVNGHRFNAADVDGDNRWDLLATGDQQLLVYFGSNFSRSFGLPSEPSQAYFLGGTSARFVEIADVNLDGNLDFVTLSRAGGIARYAVFLGTPNNDGYSFTSTGLQDAGEAGDEGGGFLGAVMGLGDVNGDDAPDIVVTSEVNNMGNVFLNDNACPNLVPRGDADESRLVDIVDPLTLLFHLFRGAVLRCPNAAEVDGVAGLTVADAVRLLRQLFLSEDAVVGDDPVECDVSA